MRSVQLLSLVFLFALSSCKKKDADQQVPLVSVNFTIYTTDPLYSSLQANGGHVYYSAGSRGVIVYRKSTEEFKAFERHCTYNVTASCGIVNVDASGITATDTCCGSSFSLTDGTVIKGPATSPLVQYKIETDGTRIHIFN